MANLTRQPYKVFAQNANADQIAVYGTMKTGTPQYSSDIATLQGNTAYGLGWDAAILNDKAPYLEEMNGLQFGASYQIGYMLQEGIPAYDANTNYSNTSIVKVLVSNELQLYHSLQNDNIGHALTESEWWTQVYFTNTAAIGVPQMTFDFNNLPVNCVWLEGATVSRTTYSNLFQIYGTTYGAGDGSTTFKLPDLRNRVLWGGTSAGYLGAGLPALSSTTASAGAHKHSYKRVSANTADADGSPASTEAVAFVKSLSSTDGTTGSAGAHTHNVTISDGYGILGAATTVRPPSIKVRFYTRYK